METSYWCSLEVVLFITSGLGGIGLDWGFTQDEPLILSLMKDFSVGFDNCLFKNRALLTADGKSNVSI